MRKAIIGGAAIGAVVGLAVVSRRLGHKMREHCGQIAAQCTQMVGGQFRNREEATGPHEHCAQMAAHCRGHAKAAETREHSEQEAVQFVDQGEAVGA